MRYETARQILAEAIELLNEDVYGDIESAKIGRRRVRKARENIGKHRDVPGHVSLSSPDHPLRKAEDRAEAMHKKRGSSDKIYTYNKPTKKFKVTGKLPKGAAIAAASQGNRLSQSGKFKMTPEHEKALLKASKKSGGIVASPSWTDPSTDSLSMDVVVRKRRAKGGKITKRSEAARDWDRF